MRSRTPDVDLPGRLANPDRTPDKHPCTDPGQRHLARHVVVFRAGAPDMYDDSLRHRVGVAGSP